MRISLNLLEDFLKKALKAGAEAADVFCLEKESFSARSRGMQLEGLEYSQNSTLSLRVFLNKKQAIVSSSDFSFSQQEELINTALHMARVLPDTPYAALADSLTYCNTPLKLELKDPTPFHSQDLIQYTQIMEEEALSTPGIKSSGGAQASFEKYTHTLLTSKGFKGSYEKTYYNLSLNVIAGTQTHLERDYAFSSALYQEDLKDPRLLGKEASNRAIKKLNSCALKTQKTPIVFDPRVAPILLRGLANGLNGAHIARGTSFLKGDMNNLLFPREISIIDDPFLFKGLASRPFDGEGLKGEKLFLIKEGAVNSWLLDLASSRQLNLKSTAHAMRNLTAPPQPSPTNLYISPGTLTPEALLKEISSGLYVTDLLGDGINLLTGDYSQGASGFWIEKGEIAYPVSGITIAGNLRDMFKTLRAANDLNFTSFLNSPTLLIEEMMVAGLS